ncbi:MAG: carboxypeptidase regulatory-like domain-containing protein [Saprospiraceae bacterium]
MKKLFTLLVLFFVSKVFIVAQATLEGSIKDNESGDPLDFAYIAIYKNGNLITGTQSDIDGNYVISNVDNGTYDVEAKMFGYTTERKTKVVLAGGKITRLDFKLSLEGVLMQEVVITEYKAPLIDIDNTTTGATVTAEKIQSLPSKDVKAIAATTAGVSTIDGSDISMRGGRTSGTIYYIDGVPVNDASLIPHSEIDQMQVITGGLEAKYGDATGGLISLTTKGPSQRTAGGVEVETSQYLDPYGYNLVSAYLSGPIIKRDGRSVLGYRLSGQYKYIKDSDPSAVVNYYAKQSVIDELEAEPVTDYKGSKVSSGLFLNGDDVENVSAAINEPVQTIDVNVKIDAQITKNLDVSLSGGLRSNNQRYLPSTNDNSSSFSSKSWALLNYNNNPYYYEDGYRANLRIRHKLGKQGIDNLVEDGENKSNSLIRNAYYTINVAYEKYKTKTEDFTHKDNLFDYGYYGSQNVEYEKVVTTVDTSVWKGRGIKYINGSFSRFCRL